MKTIRKTDYVYMEILRVLSAFAIVVIHVSGTNWSKLSIGCSDWTVQTFYNVGARFSLCVFCMITGALLLNPQKSIGIREVYGKYFKRILTCLVAWIVLYAFFYAVIERPGDLKYLIKRFFVLPKHLWYLLMLLGLYLALPVLRVITANKKVTLYLIWLLILFGMVFGTIQDVTGYFSSVAGESKVFYLWNLLLDDVNELNRTFVPGYLGCFLLGHYVHEHGVGKWSKCLVVMAVPALLLSAGLTILFSMITDSYVISFMLETNPLIVMAAVGIYEFFKGAKGKEKVYDVNAWYIKVMLFVSANSFGIYLTHFAFLVILIQYFHFGDSTSPVILSIPFNSLAVFAAALVVSVILGRIPLVKKIVT